MKVCKKCNKEFPNNMKIDGKVRNFQTRKYCLECSPFGKHNTRRIEIINLDNEEKCFCDTCKKYFIYKRGSGTKNTCGSCYVSQSRRKKKQLFIDYKGGCCQICGYDKYNGALQFHHLNPKEKEIMPTKMLTWALENAKIELDKCILLCANCHSEVHAGLHLEYIVE